jgi:acetylornithine aminotransferase/acetylornithine/N-succinyldiaminopimelate aminotransferase
MDNAEIKAISDRYLFPTYSRAPLAIVRGEGTRVWDADGREYLDFFSSTVVTALGHCHPALVAALEKQARAIFHVSNLHYCEPQALFARRLVESSFADRVFLCNSGAEANEAAIKLARKYGHAQGGGRYEIITALGSFHGRTLATIAATGQEKVRVGFEPTQGGFRYVEFGSASAVESAITERTIGVMVEPVLGEGGVIVPPAGYLADLRALCDRRDLLLILDEVQTGIGRTGTLFGYQHDGIRPDIISLAKGLGSGFPIGAMLAAAPVASAFDAGSHGSTFGGNALACAVASAVLDTIEREDLLANCRNMGERLHGRLHALCGTAPKLESVRGRGLLIAAVLNEPSGPCVDACRELGLIVNSTGGNVMRLAPPLNVRADEIDRAVDILAEVLQR